MSKRAEHYRHIRSVLIAVLFLNWAVALAKIFCGFFTHTASITADGFHSFSDGFSNVIGLIGITIASQPRDKDHPYGHKKYETLFSLGIGGLLFFVCFNLIREGLARFTNPVVPYINATSFWIMGITLCANLFVMNYEFRHGRVLKSDILISDATHTKADIFISLSVILTLIIVKSGYPMADALVTIGIALFIAYCGYEIVRDSSRVLCDTVVIVDVKVIRRVVLNVPGVEDCHKIRSRGRPDDIYIDLHALVTPEMSMEHAHKISHDIEMAVKKSLDGVTEVIVHMEPLEKPAA